MTSNIVRCVCGSVEVVGTYEVSGRFLIIKSPVGITKSVLGLQDPRKLAARLLKNTCKKACAKTLAAKPCAPSTIGERALECVDKQRDKVVAMAPDNPLRASEERMLDQMIETARIVEAADYFFRPLEEPDEASGAAIPASK